MLRSDSAFRSDYIGRRGLEDIKRMDGHDIVCCQPAQISLPSARRTPRDSSPVQGRQIAHERDTGWSGTRHQVMDGRERTVNEASVVGEQHEEEARHDAGDPSRKVLSSSSIGQEPPGKVVPSRRTRELHRVRRGAMRGACAGFLFGLVPLVGSILIGAAAGGIIAKASELRIEKGSAPRLRFIKDGEFKQSVRPSDEITA
jgi:hypothetical protein